ncbi:MAG: hypothetical protein V9G20_25135 [Candidatus Promineifilaceae bacterium]
MASCYLCDENPLDRQRYSDQADITPCPLCYWPTCRYHLTVVRWKWRDSGRTDSALICKNCRRTYTHRNWDTYHRDWIT